LRLYSETLFDNRGRFESEGTESKFKAEICSLLIAIVLFIVSAFFYSYTPGSENVSFSLAFSYPYRGYALTILGFGSVLMTAASISYSKRSKGYVPQNL
jgi:hypothetical protein